MTLTFDDITIRLNSNKKLAASVEFPAGKVYIQTALMTFSPLITQYFILSRLHMITFIELNHRQLNWI